MAIPPFSFAVSSSFLYSPFCDLRRVPSSRMDEKTSCKLCLSQLSKAAYAFSLLLESLKPRELRPVYAQWDTRNTDDASPESVALTKRVITTYLAQQTTEFIFIVFSLSTVMSRPCFERLFYLNGSACHISDAILSKHLIAVT